MTITAPVDSPAVPAAGNAGVTWTDASLVLMACIWGANFVAVRFGAQQFPPLAFNALRVLGGTLVLLAVALFHRGAWPPRRVAWRLAMLGVIGNGFYQVFFVEAIIRTSVATVAIIIASTPAWLALIGHAMGTERLHRRAWGGIAISLCGIALVLWGGARGPTGAHSWAGDLLALAGTFSWAIYTVLLRPHVQDTDRVPLHAITLAGGTVPLLLVAAPQIARTPWRAITLGGWSALAYGAIGAIVIAYLLWYRGVRLLGPTRTAMYANLQPIVALVMAAVMLGEIPTIAQGAGCAATVAGLLLTRS